MEIFRRDCVYIITPDPVATDKKTSEANGNKKVDMLVLGGGAPSC